MTPRTKAGADLAARAVAAWWQPEDPKADYMDPRSHSQSATADIRASIRAIEDEMLDKVAAAVEHMAEYWVRPERVLAAIERIRRDDE